MTNREAVIWLINVTADIGKAEHSDLWHYEQALSEIKEMLESQPERKKGKWIDTGSGQECSECHEIQYGYDNFRYFCAFCGADMREGEQDDNRRL